MKIVEVIENIKNWHEPFESKEIGRDLVLAGDVNQECTGIIITVCATMDVLKKAKESNCNFIVTHESIFYGAKEEDYEINDVYQIKKKYIEDNGLVVWRDHDRIHGNGKPFQPERYRYDYIFYGLCKELGWENYVIQDPMKPLWYKIPKTTGRELANFLIEKFNLNGLRVVGNLDSDVEIVWFCEHIQGGKMDVGKLANSLKADVLIPLEICDFTVTQYVHDAASIGQNKMIIEMGHFNCEELGMKYMCEWIQEIIHDEVPVFFVQSGDYFTYYCK